MKIGCGAFVSIHTAGLLRETGDELGLTQNQQAAMVVEAAARLFNDDRSTAAVPLMFRRYLGPIEVRFSITPTAAGSVARIAEQRRMPQEIVLANIITEAMRHARQAEPITKPFQPRRWTPARVIHEPRQSASLTASIMGDPGAQSLRVLRNDVSRGAY